MISMGELKEAIQSELKEYGNLLFIEEIDKPIIKKPCLCGIIQDNIDPILKFEVYKSRNNSNCYYVTLKCDTYSFITKTIYC